MFRVLFSVTILVLLIVACTTPAEDAGGTPVGEGAGITSPVVPEAGTAIVADTPVPDSAEEPGTTPVDLGCAAPQEGTLDWVVCNVLDGIRSRNLAALHGFMTDPFAIGTWRSEWRSESPPAVTAEIAASLLPSDPAMPLKFTADPVTFPSLDGIPAEAMLGPDVAVVTVIYSRGWGQDGSGGALLFFTADGEGDYQWHALLVAPTGF